MVRSRPHVVRVTKWRSALGPGLCPYENKLSLARWYFYHRFALALEAAGQHFRGRVLDLGCWEGHFLPSLLDNYDDVWAIENDCGSGVSDLPERWTILENAGELARAEGMQVERLHLVKADGASLPFQSEVFDVVFCLDSLPFTPAARRPAVIAEVGRVLRKTGRAVFTLPVEIGVSVLVREVLRWASGHWRDCYSWSRLVRAVRRKPDPQPESGIRNLIGYDYRPDVSLIETVFAIGAVRFLPWNWMAGFSPTILLSGRISSPRHDPITAGATMASKRR